MSGHTFTLPALNPVQQRGRDIMTDATTRQRLLTYALLLWFGAGVAALVGGYALAGNAVLAFVIVAGWVLASGPDDLTDRRELA